MDKSLLETVCKSIYRSNREFEGLTPKSSSLPNGQTLLTFHKIITTSNGHSMDRILRVTVDASGKIMKTSTSR
jgi:hypothetical protein